MLALPLADGFTAYVCFNHNQSPKTKTDYVGANIKSMQFFPIVHMFYIEHIMYYI